MKILLALFELFRKGSSVANQEAWKNGQITVTALSGLLVAITHLLSAAGLELPLDQAQIATLAAAVLVVVNVVLTVTTSKTVGLPPGREMGGDPGPHRGGDGTDESTSATPPAHFRFPLDPG